MNFGNREQVRASVFYVHMEEGTANKAEIDKLKEELGEGKAMGRMEFREVYSVCASKVLVDEK